MKKLVTFGLDVEQKSSAINTVNVTKEGVKMFPTRICLLGTVFLFATAALLIKIFG